MVARITGLEATVAKLGASNERLKQKLHWQLKRSRATSLLPQFVVTHRRRSAPHRPQSNDLQGDDHHDSPNSKRRKTNQVSDGILGSGSPILSQYRAQHCASRRIDFNNPVLNNHLSADNHSADHKSSPRPHSPRPHSPLSPSHSQRSNQLLSTDHNSPDHQLNRHHSTDHQSPSHQPHDHRSPTHSSASHKSPSHNPLAFNPLVVDQQSPNHQTYIHPSPADNHNSPKHGEHSSTHLVVDPLDHEPPNHIPATPTSDPPSSAHNSPPPAISLAQHSPTIQTSNELSPLFTAVTSQKTPLPPAPFPQGSLSQQYAPIGTLPQFDATPLNKPASQSPPSHGLTLPEPDTAPPIYDSSAFLYSPIPLLNPTPAATTPPTISPNPLFTPPPALTTTPTSSPNKPAGFSTHYSTPNAFAATATLKGSNCRLNEQDLNRDHGEGEASDSSPDKTAQTTCKEVCELSDSSPTRKTKEHQPSEAEKVLAQTFLNRPDFPHYLLVTPPPEDLWDIFAKTMAANKKG
ncbi:BnaA07g02790D [Brassica napus]|uniref:BnaA07g02790D protein n=1 Tax=Brassica napus TaxID=3708 RepID=A0A078GG90_BRANA|nr:BnaA07g02790D [Brassica napus]